MFEIKEKQKSFVVKFDKNRLRDTPKKKFRVAEYGSVEAAQEAAEIYAASIVEMCNHSKNISALIHSNQILAAGKVNVHIENINNKTGVVGVHAHRTRKGGQILGYRSSYNIDGKQIKGYFSIAKHGVEKAYYLACQHRLSVINTNIPVLLNTQS